MRLPSKLFSATVPKFALGAELVFKKTAHYSELARHVAAVQLFSGETDFEEPVTASGSAPDSEHSEYRNKKRRDAVRSLLFGSEEGAETVSVEDMADAAQQLVAARQRSMHWEASSLQALCEDELNKNILSGLSRVAT